MEIKNLNDSTFLEVMGPTPINKIIDFLITNEDFDFTLKEIAERSYVGYATIKRIWEHFTKANLVKPTRKVSKAIFYKYNSENELAKRIKSFYLDIVFTKLEEEITIEPAKKKLKVVATI